MRGACGRDILTLLLAWGLVKAERHLDLAAWRVGGYGSGVKRQPSETPTLHPKAITACSTCRPALQLLVKEDSVLHLLSGPSSSHVADLGSDFDEKVRNYVRLSRRIDR